MTLLQDIHAICIKNELPFYSYRLPQNTDVITGIQLVSEIASFDGFTQLLDGFIAVPFDISTSISSVYFRPDITFTNSLIKASEISIIQNISFKSKTRNTATQSVSKEEYLSQANGLIDVLKEKKLKKVVLSRVVNQEDIKPEQAPEIFNRLVNSYPHAFVSIFYLPGEGIWLGATPETLIESNSELLKTMSLASTKPVYSDRDWSDKELEEQQLVSDFVDQIVRQFPFEHINIDGPHDHLAGNVMHLKTSFTCEGKLNDNQLTSIVNQLHPTPAVAGLPKSEAIDYIKKVEKHDREYYSGYLGSIHQKNAHLFVNLRCMKITSSGASFFVGGGLTAQSHAESEWEETCLKLETLKKVIDCV